MLKLTPSTRHLITTNVSYTAARLAMIIALFAALYAAHAAIEHHHAWQAHHRYIETVVEDDSDE